MRCLRRTVTGFPTITPGFVRALASGEAEDLSESMEPDSGRRRPPTLNEGAIGCIYQSDEALDAAATKLLDLGIEARDIHVGAADDERARQAAQRTGVRADIAADDPLEGLLGHEPGSDARAAMDRGGLIGAVAGALFGIVIGFTPAGAAVAMTRVPLLLANALLYFVLGAIIGSVLAAALAPQPSTHAGFRLIDGMQDGALALIVVAPRDRLDELERAMESAGGSGSTRV